MNVWTWVKYALAVAGISLVILSDRVQRRWLGYVGLGLILAAFLLRFVSRTRRAG